MAWLLTFTSASLSKLVNLWRCWQKRKRNVLDDFFNHLKVEETSRVFGLRNSWFEEGTFLVSAIKWTPLLKLSATYKLGGTVKDGKFVCTKYTSIHVASFGRQSQIHSIGSIVTNESTDSSLLKLLSEPFLHWEIIQLMNKSHSNTPHTAPK